jgi:hypothetical protein
MPPKKRDWTAGIPQIGIFVRSAMGGQLEWVNDKATEDELAWACLLIRGIEELPDELRAAVREAWSKRKGEAAAERRAGT